MMSLSWQKACLEFFGSEKSTCVYLFSVHFNFRDEQSTSIRGRLYLSEKNVNQPIMQLYCTQSQFQSYSTKYSQSAMKKQSPYEIDCFFPH